MTWTINIGEKKDEQHVARERERERDGEIDGGDLEKWVGCTLY